MKFELSTQNLEEAIRSHVKKTINLREGQSIQIEFTNGRGPKGVTATAEIVDVHSAGDTGEACSNTATEAPTAAVERVNGKVVTATEEPVAEASNAEAATPGLFATL